jgi:nitrogen fixation protein FixH
MNWGHKIIITFVIFAGIIITMVVISMRQEISLVAPDYYKQEIAYSQQMEKLENGQNAGLSAPKIEYLKDQRKFILSCTETITGEIHFYRPSDASKDIKLKFDLEGLPKTFDASEMISGLWRVKMTWDNQGKTYFTEKNIVI